MARHKHWPADHPNFEQAPWCDLPTKKACDERWRTERGRVVKFSKEDWEAKQIAMAEAAKVAGAVADEEYGRAYVRHVKEILSRESTRGTDGGHQVQAVRLPRSAIAKRAAALAARTRAPVASRRQ